MSLVAAETGNPQSRRNHKKRLRDAAGPKDTQECPAIRGGLASPIGMSFLLEARTSQRRRSAPSFRTGHFSELPLTDIGDSCVTWHS